MQFTLYTKDPTLQPYVVLDCILPKVIEEMNVHLGAPFTEKEISNALFQIGPMKAPGPDGFRRDFFSVIG